MGEGEGLDDSHTCSGAGRAGRRPPEVRAAGAPLAWLRPRLQRCAAGAHVVVGLVLQQQGARAGGKGRRGVEGDGREFSLGVAAGRPRGTHAVSVHHRQSSNHPVVVAKVGGLLGPGALDLHNVRHTRQPFGSKGVSSKAATAQFRRCPFLPQHPGAFPPPTSNVSLSRSTKPPFALPSGSPIADTITWVVDEGRGRQTHGICCGAMAAAPAGWQSCAPPDSVPSARRQLAHLARGQAVRGVKVCKARLALHSAGAGGHM